jgi:NAD(P)-dependent dehydrogenase (short-subunit alcohol dehydrogenase family)
MRLQDKRVLVVGASAGIGLASAKAIAAEGARVAFAARRTDRLEKAAAEAGGGAIALECDVQDEASCHAVVANTVQAFGGLDAVVYAPGITNFCPIEQIDAALWRSVLNTNLVGPSLVMNAAIPHLEDSRGRAVFLSSIVIDDSPPRAEQTTYVVSKVALETLVAAWQNEHRKVGFTSIALGDTLSEFGFAYDPKDIERVVKRWTEEGYLYGRMMQGEDIAEQVVNALAANETIRRIAITPRFPESEPD